LGVADKYALDVFSAVHTDNKKMQDPKVFLEWAEKKGLERKKVEDIYQSFSINSKLTRARSLVENHKIESVPSIVVNGKYLTGPHMLPGGHASIGDALNTLLEKARKDKK
jgi:protein dithiol oxidoreductase (disulfide-forming)